MIRPGYSCQLRVTSNCPPLGDLVLSCCENVYEPAEDTWLALDILEKTLVSNGYSIVLDVGCGTGVLGVYTAAKTKTYTVLIDVNPCATYCAKTNTERLGLSAYVDIVQCDNATCIRRLGTRTLAVYNTPYLPVEEYDELLGLAWSGGLREAQRIVDIAGEWASCIILVYSSLSGDDRELVGKLRDRGFGVERYKIHFFFEDIVGVRACRVLARQG
ncbi:methyltransferase [Hyperthermus butylicus]|uniref:Conserved archaeal protein n=1 Tax=Hyperthermus butylicus (strain DSM 5456 / JCM 9403 / PLM1-5) TaxID=415426 RepID=A2BNA9_HYPBU|nr:methyltransferase [Hyperthermus butylicus]ABM81470.1 conserved archaeal protein [Hyperthermus butylicus DSM 5456]